MQTNQYSENEDQFIKDNYAEKGSKFCAEKLNRKPSSIVHRANRLGLKVNKVYHKLKAELFHPTPKTPEVIYLLGFLWADGYVSNYEKTRSHRVAFSIAEKDGLELKPIILSTGDWDIRLIPKYQETWQNQISGYASDDFIVPFLRTLDYEIKSGASAKKILDIIPENLQHYWWRGFFDGDGHFGKNNKNKHSVFNIGSVYDQDWSFVEKLFDKLSIKSYDIRQKIQFNKHTQKNSKHSVVIVQNYWDVYRIGKYIYQNYENDKIGLSRKYDRWKFMAENFRPQRKNNIEAAIYFRHSWGYSIYVRTNKYYKEGFKTKEEAIEGKRQKIIEVAGLPASEEYGFEVPYFNGIVCNDVAMLT